ncbi:MAG: glucose-6-phosphate dehydrogenase, partial [Planctomycetota bacterium]|nr:glucose-6-phosphate dehydrogenase [Planctomycetota bacterium]
NYPVGSWGPKSAFDLIERDGRRWVETISREVLEQVPLFEGGDPVFLHSLVMMLKPMVVKGEEFIIERGDVGTEMYFINRGEVEVLDVN